MKFPILPQSLRGKASGTREVLGAVRQLPPVRTGGQPAAFLGLKSRLSQIWLNRWTVLLILVLVHVILLLGDLNEKITESKAKALSACTKVEDVGSAMASMPHYLSVGVNNIATEGISAAIRGMVTVLTLILTAVENIIFFVINFYVGTYVCLIAAFIHGTFDIGIGAADAVTKVMNDAIGKISGGIADELSQFSSKFNEVVGRINGGTGLFGSGLSFPTIPDVSSRLNDLKGIKVDNTEFVKTLSNIKDKTPTFDDVKDLAQKAIAIPFDKVRDELNKSTTAWMAPRDLFPVAQKQALSFCSDNTSIRDFFDGLYRIASGAKIGFLVVIPLLAIAVCAPMAWIEIRKYREQKALARQMTNQDFDAMDVIYQASRPKSSRTGIWLSRRFKGTNRENLVRWAWAYCTSLPALFVLSLAIAGLFSCLCQSIVLLTVQKEAPALVNKVGDFADDVVRTLDGISTKWAGDANGVILKYTDDVNNDVLGKVRTATSAVNSTLNVFNDEMNKRLDSVFAGTVLHNTVKDVVRCLIGLKIEAVEKGLTWVHEHARVSFPLFPNDTFSAGAAESVSGDSKMASFLASPSTVTTDEITDAVMHVVNFLKNGLIRDALIALGLLLVYVILVLVGVIRALLNIKGPTRTRGDGGGLRGQRLDNPFVDPSAASKEMNHPRGSDSDSHRTFAYEMTSNVAHGGAQQSQRRFSPPYRSEKGGYFEEEDDERDSYGHQPPASVYQKDSKNYRNYGH